MDSPNANSGTLLSAIGKLGLSVALFGGVFLASTVFVTLIVTPDRFPVHIGGTIVRLKDLEAEQKALLLAKANLQTRRSPVTGSKAPVLHQVQRIAETLAPVGQAMIAVDDVRASFKAGASDPISFPSVIVSGSGSKIFLGGQVRDTGGRSTQILAAFVDGLRSIPLVQSVSEPEYVQQNAAEGATVSPFSLTLTLKHAAP